MCPFHSQLSKSNARMAHQLKTQEDDRLFLVKQLVAIKKENARLRMAVSAQTATMSLDSSSSSMALLASTGTRVCWLLYCIRRMYCVF
jgi:hypothetical protein